MLTKNYVWFTPYTVHLAKENRSYKIKKNKNILL